jgi:phenylacetate-coenzyme A ligase PaaK-like adenylate-forming protein
MVKGLPAGVFVTLPAWAPFDGPFDPFWRSFVSATASATTADIEAKQKAAREKLDAHAYETVQWHFHPSTGCPFWLEKAKSLKFDPLKEVKNFDDLKKFDLFEDEWLRGGPVRRWVPKGFEGKPVYVFETGGTTGIPKSRIAIDDFRTDYELFSHTLPEEYFPKGANWLMLGPSGPRRLRLAVEHLCQYRGGICFCIDLDPRWVIKLIKKGWMEHLEAYKEHCIDQALTILSAGHDIKCMFTTPKLLESLATALEKKGSSIAKAGITGIFSGGTEFTPQWTRFATEEFLEGVYMTPTYGNTLMGLACSKPVTAAEGYKISYYAPQPRAAIEVVDFDDPHKVVGYGQTGRVKLTTLTKEFFVPSFLERDEGEREPPFEKYPWDGVSGVRPFRALAEGTTVGVY